MRQRMKNNDRYPLVLMLEPLFRCNLACPGCGKIDYEDDILNRRLSAEECLHAVDECGAPIGVSVLCPAAVRTGLLDPDRGRPEGVAAPQADGSEAAAAQEEAMQQVLAKLGIEPEVVADQVASAVRAKRFWIFTHAGSVDYLRDRAQRLFALERPEITGIDQLPQP